MFFETLIKKVSRMFGKSEESTTAPVIEKKEAPVEVKSTTPPVETAQPKKEEPVAPQKAVEVAQQPVVAEKKVEVAIAGVLSDADKERAIVEYKTKNPDASVRSVAALVGVSYVTALKAVKANNLKHNARNNYEDVAMYYLNHTDMIREELAKELNISVATLQRILARYNLSESRDGKKHHHLTEQKKALILRYKAENPEATLKEMGDKFLCSMTTISKVIKTDVA